MQPSEGLFALSMSKLLDLTMASVANREQYIVQGCNYRIASSHFMKMSLSIMDREAMIFTQFKELSRRFIKVMVLTIRLL